MSGLLSVLLRPSSRFPWQLVRPIERTKKIHNRLPCWRTIFVLPRKYFQNSHKWINQLWRWDFEALQILIRKGISTRADGSLISEDSEEEVDMENNQGIDSVFSWKFQNLLYFRHSTRNSLPLMAMRNLVNLMNLIPMTCQRPTGLTYLAVVIPMPKMKDQRSHLTWMTCGQKWKPCKKNIPVHISLFWCDTWFFLLLFGLVTEHLVRSCDFFVVFFVYLSCLNSFLKYCDQSLLLERRKITKSKRPSRLKKERKKCRKQLRITFPKLIWRHLGSALQVKRSLWNFWKQTRRYLIVRLFLERVAFFFHLETPEEPLWTLFIH